MRGILRVGLMVLLVAASGVGIVRGEWKDYTPSIPGAITWQYEKIDATKCRIKPKDTATVGNAMEVPDNVGSLKVVEIAESAFEKCRRMTGVTLPNSVTTIGSRAFSGCERLTTVHIPSSVTTIENYVFSGCIGLEEFKVDKESASFCADGGVLFTKKKDKLVRCPSKKGGGVQDSRWRGDGCKWSI